MTTIYSKHVTLSEVVERVKEGRTPNFRPTLPDNMEQDINPAILNLIKECWEENPDDRPSLGHIKQTLRSFNKGRFVKKANLYVKPDIALI